MYFAADVFSGNKPEGVVHMGVLQQWFGIHWWNSREFALIFTMIFILFPLVLYRRVGKCLKRFSLMYIKVKCICYSMNLMLAYNTQIWCYLLLLFLQSHWSSVLQYQLFWLWHLLQYVLCWQSLLSRKEKRRHLDWSLVWTNKHLSLIFSLQFRSL